ncbi:2-hydroxyacyl-CoA dehydratase [Neobacillus sp. YIM B02564]|jgi:predicted CoA-substrate-specific enzyme activase|uniref:2-hydroxyacyl-CoA dehydratase n=1 Tax=Neobacillus paridis TaxID=2803862 RepID=A0ABS1TPD7_9BACI|nr:2-hydroxyacyl-CoA dehydratase [Neobacillus paridis]MBL4953112.1 2-hydroxyacyl-CoA dehydratase [Neobacillus paridis]
MELKVGLDVGSTTAKLVALNNQNEIVFKFYQRHFSDIKTTTLRLLRLVSERFPYAKLKMNASGSSGLGLCEPLGIPFIQEVVACTEAVKSTENDIDVIIELGGEDAKIIYLTNGIEQRMNAACAGGTGAFIDQIATLLNTDAAGLNELAKGAEKIYPIASRCGVFAKTDIQPLINEGARKEDIAASVFQAVVNQTIAGLANGRPIRGNVAFLGGPLTFLSELRKSFIHTLKLTGEHILYSQDGHYYVAIGAALESNNNESIEVDKLIQILANMDQAVNVDQSKRLEPLFRSKADYEAFKSRHSLAKVKQSPLSAYSGHAFLGIDAGSTTTKMVLTGETDEVLFRFYEKNKGNPIGTVREGLTALYQALPVDVKIVRSTVTGYGEKLIQAAFRIDDGEIETVAHYTAAKQFQPDVDFIIDIGGQDMKCIKIKNGVIDQILLNEACSSGCGSFLESFAETLEKSVQEFSEMALMAEAPADLGSRCTVFMNSKVKQLQKEGASIPDISAGLAHSIISNAIYKVIKLKSAEQLGNHVVVQGGTFLNDAVLRSFEKITGKQVIRPDMAGLMGAYGCALIAKERWDGQSVSSLLPVEQLGNFTLQTFHRRCGKCENNCPITVNKFSDKRSFITGNRCERGAGKQKQKSPYPNLVEEKLDKVFNRVCLEGDEAERGKIGLPRVLNMFDNYPFWHRFFTELSFEVVLSDPSSKAIFEKGIETIPSESVCYPAKLSHGHILNLIEKGVKTIFYPSVVFEKRENQAQQNHYNCPIVASYPEVIRVNLEKVFIDNQVTYLNPFLTIDHPAALLKNLSECFQDIPKVELKRALKKAQAEKEAYTEWLHRRGEEVIAQLRKEQRKGIVFSGHPYHIDPAINHGIPGEINKLGFAVLTEDAIVQLAPEDLEVDVVNQWTYHSRLYQAADVVKKEPCLELLQVTSFGCGLDAITTDAVQEILEESNQLYTWIKMDEVSNLGAARIRLRSLNAAIEERENHPELQHKQNTAKIRPPKFAKGDKKRYTILAPQLLPSHFDLFAKAFALDGYDLKILQDVKDADVEVGLRYVNNDACYPAVITIGQLVGALKNGEYDLDRTAVIMSQTGGGCRATNYFALLKKALRNAGMPQVPVISLNGGGMEKKNQPGFKISPTLAKSMVIAACLGDLLMRLKLTVRPYEKVTGSTEKVYQKWLESSKQLLEAFSMRAYKKVINEIIADFSEIEMIPERKPRVGIVGEILVKFHPYANNQLIETIEKEGGEAVVPDFIDFFLYGLYNRKYKVEHFGKSKLNIAIGTVAIQLIEYYRSPIREALLASERFEAPLKISEVAEKASRFLSIGNQMGEGWLLPGEMVELMDSGVDNVVCVQPFGCLPNHVIGRGMFNGIKKEYPNANIISIDYDSSISKVNQVNRIKLMINIAKNKLKQENDLIMKS